MEFQYKRATLVYSKFDKNGPVPNGYDMFDNGILTYFSGNSYFTTHLNDPYDSVDSESFFENRRIQYNVTSLDNIDNSVVSFYIICHANVNYEFMATEQFKIPTKLIQSIQKNNLYLTLLQEHETCTEEEFVRLCERFKQLEIPLSKVILLNNNSKLYEYENKYKYGVKVHHSNFLYFSFTKTLKMLNSNWVDNKEGKFFISRNRNPKPHRVSFLSKLFTEDLIKDFNYSFIPNESYKLYDFEPYLKFFDENYIEINKDILNFISTHRKEDDYESGRGWIDLKSGNFTHQKDFHSIYHIPELSKSFENSYFNVVTESLYQSEFNSIHITEKSLRPFYFYQFPIFISTPHHIKYLKKDYDFDLFDDVIDHSYDDELDDIKRFNMVIDEIKRISNNKQFFIEFYKNNKKRFEKNKQICLDRGFEAKKYDLDFFWNLL